jgi:hypothetical protein
MEFPIDFLGGRKMVYSLAMESALIRSVGTKAACKASGWPPNNRCRAYPGLHGTAVPREMITAINRPVSSSW